MINTLRCQSNLKSYIYTHITLQSIPVSVTFTLTRVQPSVIATHLRRNSTHTIQSSLLTAYPWIYLSNFYASDGAPPRLATRLLRAELSRSKRPFILCCEPILGDNPRAITTKNSEMTVSERYTHLCRYYTTQFGLKDSIPTCTTLKTEMTGHGRRWSDMDRMLIFGMYTHVPNIIPHIL